MPPYQQIIPTSETTTIKDLENISVNSLTECFVEKLRMVVMEENRAKMEKERSLLLEDLEKERDQVKKALRDLEEEKERLRKQLSEIRQVRECRMEEKKRLKKKLGVVGLNDAIELNVGGQAMTVKRSTLTQVKSSLLSSMFCGQWEDTLERDKQGRIFLDFNPDCFKKIVDALRSLRMATPCSSSMSSSVAFKEEEEDSSTGPVIKLSGIDPDLHYYFSALIDYLGLGSIIFSEDDPSSYVGKRMEVYWSRYDKYYTGFISSYCSKTRTHKVSYDDGDVQNYDLSTCDWRFTKPYIEWIRRSN